MTDEEKDALELLDRACEPSSGYGTCFDSDCARTLRTMLVLYAPWAELAYQLEEIRRYGT